MLPKYAVQASGWLQAISKNEYELSTIVEEMVSICQASIELDIKINLMQSKNKLVLIYQASIKLTSAHIEEKTCI